MLVIYAIFLLSVNLSSVKSADLLLSGQFSDYDKNDDSMITIHEFSDYARTLGLDPTKDMLPELMKQIDLDGNGSVDSNEFAKAKVDKGAAKKTDVENSFRIFDENGDRFITTSEMKNAFQKLGQSLDEEEVNIMLAEADKDTDGRINKNEFVNLMSRLDS